MLPQLTTKATIITADGKRRDVLLPPSGEARIGLLQGIIGDAIEIQYYGKEGEKEKKMYMDDCGLLKGLPENKTATALLNDNAPVFGTVVIVEE